MKLIHEEAGDNVDVIFGARVDENMQDQLQVTVIATGFNRQPIEEKVDIRSTQNRNSEDLMDSPNTTLYQENNPEPGFQMDDHEENGSNKEDGPTLVFDDFDQSADLDVPAYIRKQR